jgi:hypothetical protein
VLGYTALEFGLGTAVMTVMAVVGAAGGQAIVTRLGFPSVAVVGLALTGGPDRLSGLTEEFQATEVRVGAMAINALPNPLPIRPHRVLSGGGRSLDLSHAGGGIRTPDNTDYDSAALTS